jgi:hypothetical protein
MHPFTLAQQHDYSAPDIQRLTSSMADFHGLRFDSRLISLSVTSFALSIVPLITLLASGTTLEPLYSSIDSLLPSRVRSPLSIVVFSLTKEHSSFCVFVRCSLAVAFFQHCTTALCDELASFLLCRLFADFGDT